MYKETRSSSTCGIFSPGGKSTLRTRLKNKWMFYASWHVCVRIHQVFLFFFIIFSEEIHSTDFRAAYTFSLYLLLLLFFMIVPFSLPPAIRQSRKIILKHLQRSTIYYINTPAQEPRVLLSVYTQSCQWIIFLVSPFTLDSESLLRVYIFICVCVCLYNILVFYIASVPQLKIFYIFFSCVSTCSENVYRSCSGYNVHSLLTSGLWLKL